MTLRRYELSVTCPSAVKKWRAGQDSYEACRARHFLKNSPISLARKIDGERSSSKVISLARLRHHLAISEFAISLSVFRSRDFRTSDARHEQPRENRPDMPEAALRRLAANGIVGP